MAGQGPSGVWSGIPELWSGHWLMGICTEQRDHELKWENTSGNRHWNSPGYYSLVAERERERPVLASSFAGTMTFFRVSGLDLARWPEQPTGPRRLCCRSKAGNEEKERQIPGDGFSGHSPSSWLCRLISLAPWLQSFTQWRRWWRDQPTPWPAVAGYWGGRLARRPPGAMTAVTPPPPWGVWWCF